MGKIDCCWQLNMAHVHGTCTMGCTLCVSHTFPHMFTHFQVMEFCDRASLRHAMKKGVFHKRLGNTSVAVDLCAIVQVSQTSCRF